MDIGVHSSPEDFISTVKVIARLKFELTYCDIVIQHDKHNVVKNPSGLYVYMLRCIQNVTTGVAMLENNWETSLCSKGYFHTNLKEPIAE